MGEWFLFSSILKMQFDAALGKFSICLDQLQHYKEVKNTENWTKIHLYLWCFWKSSADLKILQCPLILIYFHALQHVRLGNVSLQQYLMFLGQDAKCAKR